MFSMFHYSIKTKLKCPDLSGSTVEQNKNNIKKHELAGPQIGFKSENYIWDIVNKSIIYIINT